MNSTGVTSLLLSTVIKSNQTSNFQYFVILLIVYMGSTRSCAIKCKIFFFIPKIKRLSTKYCEFTMILAKEKYVIIRN